MKKSSEEGIITSYAIKEQLLSKNRPYTPLSPQGLVIHSTATPGATAQNEFNYFNSVSRAASAHYFVDWNEILRTIPENEIAWHAGGTANSLYLSIEMCEPYGQDTAKFTEVWNRTVWLAADICIRYGWPGSQNIWSHQDTSQLYGQTDHTDPISYLRQYGKSWAELESTIDSKIAELKNQTGGLKMINNLILYAYDADARAAAYLGDHLSAPIIRLDNVLKEDLDSAKNIYVVGGSKKPVERAILLTGYTKFDTCRRVLDFIDTGK